MISDRTNRIRRVCKLCMCVVAFCLLSARLASGDEVAPNEVYSEFHIGVSGIFATIQTGLNVRVESMYPGSPSDGLFLSNDVLTAVNGFSLSTNDPRVVLGEQIGVAEGTDGSLDFTVYRAGTNTSVVVTLPVIGSYATNWPLDCAKSSNIIAQTVQHILSTNHLEGADLDDINSGLFLLSTGDDAYLPNVKVQVDAIIAVPPTSHYLMWHLGPQAILLSEYYLRTGDSNVLWKIQEIVDRVLPGQVVGGWGHDSAGPAPGYVQGGLVNNPGGLMLIGMTLARECGVSVPEGSYRKSLKFFYRFAGHGDVPYGDHRTGGGGSASSNGKNGLIACAYSLLDTPGYQEAAELWALMTADNYTQLEEGHTGGGLNVIWRGLSTVHVPSNRMDHYRRHMDEMAWYYDLIRLPGGGMDMPPFTGQEMGCYHGTSWGVGVALGYTAPLKNLRITGGPRTVYSVSNIVPPVLWGNTNDLDFLSTELAAGYGTETNTPDKTIENLFTDGDNMSASYLGKMLRHYNPSWRGQAARLLAMRADANSINELETALQHSDARVRRAALEGASGYDTWKLPMSSTAIDTMTVSTQLMPHIQVILDNTNVAWWEMDGALLALGKAEPADIRTNTALIDSYSMNSDPFLREAAFVALSGLRTNITSAEFFRLAEMYTQAERVKIRHSMKTMFDTLLNTDGVKAALSPTDREAVVLQFGKVVREPLYPENGGAESMNEAVYRTFSILDCFEDTSIMDLLADEVVQFFNQYDDEWYKNPYSTLFSGGGEVDGLDSYAMDEEEDGAWMIHLIQQQIDSIEQAIDDGEWYDRFPVILPALSNSVDTYEASFGALPYPAIGPVAVTSPDYTTIDYDGNGFADVYLDGVQSYDMDGSLITHVWETNGAVVARGQYTSIALPLGTNAVTLRVTDEHALFSESILTITVVTNQLGSPSNAPTAMIDSNLVFSLSERGGAYVEVTVDGSGSSDPDGTVVSYVWSSSNIVYGSGPIAQLDMPLGNHDLVLTVFDNNGLCASNSISIDVNPVAGSVPDAPLDLMATAGNGKVSLAWTPNTEPDLAGYCLYRAESALGPYSLLAGSLSTNTYLDTDVQNGQSLWYIVRATSLGGDESAPSIAANAIPLSGDVNVFSSTMRAGWDFESYAVQDHPNSVSYPNGLAGTEGRFTDMSGNGHVAYGTSHGIPNVPWSATGGKFGGGYYGQSDTNSRHGSSAMVNHHADINFSQEDFTVFCWEKTRYRIPGVGREAGSGIGALFYKAPNMTGQPGGEGYGYMWLFDKFYFTGNADGNNGTYYHNSIDHWAWDNNRWAHVALVGDYQATNDSYNMKTYIDGAHVVGLDTVLTNDVIDNTGPFTMGHFWYGTGYPVERTLSHLAYDPATGTVAEAWMDDVAIFEGAWSNDRLNLLIDMGNHPDLGYNLKTVVSLMDVHDKESALNIGLVNWAYATNLIGIGLSGDITNGFELVLDEAADTGLISTPVANPPNPPTNLLAVEGEGFVSIGWDSSVNPALRDYTLYRSMDANGPFVEFMTGLVVNAYTDTTTTVNVEHFYMITMTTTNGLESGGSAISSAVPFDATIPAIPTGLVAVPGNRRVDLDWDDNLESDMSHYLVYRSATPDGPYLPVITNAYLSMASDITVTNEISYYYVVKACDLSGNTSSNSIEVSETPHAFPLGTGPENLTTTTNLLVQVTLSWDDPFDKEDSYRIDRAADSNFLVDAATFDLAANATNYVDQSVSPGAGYYYRVVGVLDGWLSEYSLSAQATVPLAFAPGLAPSNLIATIPTFMQVDLSWQDTFSTETGYRVQRAADSGFTVDLTTFDIGVNATNYTDNSPSAGIINYYRVAALNSGWPSEYSLTASALAKAFPVGVSPSNLTVTAVDFLQVALSWEDPFDTESGFVIERATDVSFTNGVRTFNAGENATSYVDRVVLLGTNCYYRVAGVNGVDLSEYSVPVSIVTPTYMGGSLAAYYDFEGDFDDHPGAGLVADDLVTVTGGVLTNDVPANAKGSTQSYYVDNNISYQSAHTGAWSPDLASWDAYTFMCWIKGDNQLQNMSSTRLVTMSSRPDGELAAEPAFTVIIATAADLRFLDPLDYGSPTTMPTPAPDVLGDDANAANDAWHHIAFVVCNSGSPGNDYAYIKTFKDGVFVSPLAEFQGSTGNPWGNTYGELIIGGHSKSARSATAYIDDVAIFSGAVTDSNILAIATGAKSPSDFARKNFDLQLEKTANTTNLDASTNLTYTISVTNYGTWAADGVEIIDSMPSNMTCVSSVPVASQTNGNDYTFVLGTMAVGGVTSIVINAEPTASLVGGGVTNIAVVSSTDTELIGTNNQDSAWTIIPDTDADTLVDWIEVNVYGSSHTNADSDADGVDDADEVNTYGSNLLDPDTDGDGMIDGDEVYAGTILTNPASLLCVTSNAMVSTNFVMNWSTVSGKTYTLWANTNLVSTNWWQVGGIITGTPPANSITVTPAKVECQFYKIRVE